jgi:carbamoylphosphate synthase large subunit
MTASRSYCLLNPATIMTLDPSMATRTYDEPVTPESVARIIERVRPDALLQYLEGRRLELCRGHWRIREYWKRRRCDDRL